jgi:hypothetical protein
VTSVRFITFSYRVTRVHPGARRVVRDTMLLKVGLGAEEVELRKRWLFRYGGGSLR